MKPALFHDNGCEPLDHWSAHYRRRFCRELERS